MYRSTAAIESWLSQSDSNSTSDAQAHGGPNRKRTRSAETDLDDHDVPLLNNPAAAPRSSRTSPSGFSLSKAILPHAPVPSSIRSSTSQSDVSASSSKTARTKRSSSPVKNTDGLQYLDKPAIYKHLGDDVGQLPADALTLWDAVYDVVATSACIYPPEIRSEIISLHRRPPPESNFGPAAVEGPGTRVALGEDSGRDASLNSTIAMQDEFPDQLPAVWAFARASAHPSVTRQRLARAELLAVQNIIREACRCLDGKYTEAAWNSKVHEPLLELVLFRHDPHVAYVNATSAKILPAFMPSFSTGNTIVEGKMINFVMTRCLDYENPVPADAELAAAIRAKLECQPGSRPLTVNQPAFNS
jgi:hypothetical protein